MSDLINLRNLQHSLAAIAMTKMTMVPRYHHLVLGMGYVWHGICVLNERFFVLTHSQNVGEDTSDADNHTQAEQPEAAPREEKLRRDEWMTMPPKQDDLAARLDPTKPRPRGFNTSKGANGPNAAAADGSAWHETPEQKQKRLADEMMGVTTSNADVESRATTGPRKPADHDTARKIKEHTARSVSFVWLF